VNRAPRDWLASLHRAALDAVDPASALREVVRRDGDRVEINGRTLPSGSRLFVLAAGKAAGAMAGAFEAVAGDRIAKGLVVVPDGVEASLAHCTLLHSAHPVPDAQSEQAGRAALALVSEAGPDDVVVALISGGASSLLSCPAAGVSIDDFALTTQLLLAGGAPIDELNAVRKHLSRVSGGRLAQHSTARHIELLMISDVPGDRPDVVGSGPFVGDPTSFAGALTVLARRCGAAAVPASVRARLEAGARGECEETPRPGDERFEQVYATVLASNDTALAAARRHAQRGGALPLVFSGGLTGPAARAGRRLAALGRCVRHSEPVCVIAGGETTVEVRGAGRGGRNQELALAAAIELDGDPSVTLLAVGSDGVDGPTDAAGAFADGQTVVRGRNRGLDADAALANNDSYAYFSGEGGVVKTGPSGTNVMDLAFLWVAVDSTCH
jgi:glycerate-2-kinase